MTARKKRIVALILIALAVVSVVFSLKVDAMKVNKPVISVLDDQKKDAETLTVSTTLIASAVALVPGDATNPIADKLIDVSGYLMLVVCGVFLEKYLLMLMWYFGFTILIPIGLIMLAGFYLAGWETLRRFGVKLLIFAIAAGIAIPASVGMACVLEKTNDMSVKQRIAKVEEVRQDASVIKSGSNSSGISALFDSGKSKVAHTAKYWAEKCKATINNVIETIAIMIITSCVLPILTLLFFIWLLKALFGIMIKPKFPGRKPHEVTRKYIDEIKENIYDSGE